MKVMAPVMASTPFSMKTSAAMALPCTDRLAAMVTMPAVPVRLQLSAFARPLSPVPFRPFWQMAGAWANNSLSVIRLAGRSSSRFRGMVTACPPTVTVPPDQ